VLDRRALESFIVAFMLVDRSAVFVGVHVRCLQLTPSHISCPPNQGNANCVIVSGYAGRAKLNPGWEK
jgi:hypothetical protein